MSALAELGLDAGADEQAVRMAYARLLRESRPDSDPEGYQRLRIVYDAALRSVRLREAGAVRTRPAERAAGARPLPAPEVGLAIPADLWKVDSSFIAMEVREHAQTLEPRSFAAWLAKRFANVSYPQRRIIAPFVLRAADAAQARIASANLRTIGDVFAFSDVLSGIDHRTILLLNSAIGVQEQRERSAAFVRLFDRAHLAELCAHMASPERGAYGKGSTYWYRFLLTAPFPLRVVRVLRTMPALANGLRAFIMHLDARRTDALSPALRPDVVECWLAPGTERAEKWWLATVQLVMICAILLIFNSNRISSSVKMLTGDGVILSSEDMRQYHDIESRTITKRSVLDP